MLRSRVRLICMCTCLVVLLAFVAQAQGETLANSPLLAVTPPVQTAHSPDEALAASRSAAAAAYAAEHDVSRQRAQVVLALQAKTVSLPESLRRALGSHYGQVWLDHGGITTNEVVVDVSSHISASQLAATEAILTAHGIAAGQRRIVEDAVTEAELEAEMKKLVKQLSKYISSGRVQVAIVADAQLEVAIAADATESERHKIESKISSHKYAVAPVVRVTEEPSYEITPTYYEIPGFGGPPLIAGMYYQKPASTPGYIIICTLGFLTTSPVNSNPFYQTAGHCVESAGTEDTACFSASNCAPVGPDVGGWAGPELDFGLIEDNNTGTWPAYPAVVTWGWAYDTLGVFGASSPVIGELICHTGWGSASHGVAGTSCAEVTSTNASAEYDGYMHYEAEASGSGLCVFEGDSGGPVFDGNNGYAVGITDAEIRPAEGTTGECGTHQRILFTSAPVAAADDGVSIETTP